jgi:hypothetical protein
MNFAIENILFFDIIIKKTKGIFNFRPKIKK